MTDGGGRTLARPLSVPQGVLRIHLVEAHNLIAKDNFMGGIVKGKSDPYVKIRVAGITYRSHTIKENLNPVWNELYEVIALLPAPVFVFFGVISCIFHVSLLI